VATMTKCMLSGTYLLFMMTDATKEILRRKWRWKGADGAKGVSWSNACFNFNGKSGFECLECVISLKYVCLIVRHMCT
jgi:hypothetical protein